ncbi:MULTISPECIES: MotA/TolQ/ExbB proton channel family protein [unclassified Microbulbifer]|uniref:MotA/TolQ/ExbB proton channel family protein n=1 Tax=Microbulbifer spongiae TaxID=2944933 RepID=A0ABY9ECH3_9GAMM|nr:MULTISPECIES: MotA/TolQ/ExbB proton channel family protein [unclassified Microbulbifer]MDP5209413.1 MotA/TolQ/ExbB proton channel family protein [Microbulbifer sp. 2205BS26-8]WKD49214.1 MotA/TolQ/ExbB proton channel family protein [Microbulbifer sp. MI-G]
MNFKSSEFVFQLFALLASIILVHAIYVAIIRPNADALIEEQLAREAAGETYVQQRSIYIVMRDYEQEACFVLMLWAMAIMVLKAQRSIRERKLLDKALLNISEGTSILPEDTRDLSRPIQALPESERSFLVPRALLTALQRFGSTQNVAAVSNSVKEVCETEGDRLDSELAMVRYITWAIPSIGFIGTVRGIGEALSQAHKAVEGDIAGVTVSLGVAFNSTFIALVISIVIMFFTHQLQLMQERLVLDTQNYCDNRLLRFLKIS